MVCSHDGFVAKAKKIGLQKRLDKGRTKSYITRVNVERFFTRKVLFLWCTSMLATNPDVILPTFAENRKKEIHLGKWVNSSGQENLFDTKVVALMSNFLHIQGVPYGNGGFRSLIMKNLHTFQNFRRHHS